MMIGRTHYSDNTGLRQFIGGDSRFQKRRNRA
jgi:hypothetical protein